MSEHFSIRSAAVLEVDFLPLAGLALDSAPDVILWTDAGGRLIYANRSASLSLEYSRDELLSFTLSDICGELPPQLWAKYWRELKAAGHRVLTLSLRCRSGRSVLLEVSASFLEKDGKEYFCAFGRDVTQRTRAELQQAEAMKQLETIFDAMQAGVVMINPQGGITFANQRVADMFGCPLAELIGSSYAEHVHPMQRQAGDERLRRLVAGEIDHVYNLRHFIRRDGGDFWGHLSGRRLVDSRGNTVSLVGVIADISEMKQAEEELRRREQQFTSLADNLPDVVARFDRSFRRLYVNGRVEAMTGIAARDFIGKTNQDLGIPPVKEWEDAVTRVFDSGEIAEIRVEFPTAAGMKYFESRIIPERGEDGSVETVLGISRDVTDAVLAEQQLKESEKRYRTIIENMQDVYYRSDACGRLTMVSPSGAALLGYDSAEQMLDLGMGESFHRDPGQRSAFLDTLMREGQVNGYELTLKRRDGTPVPVAASSHLLFAPDGSFIGVEGVYRDMSLFRQAMDRLKSSEDKFVRAFNHAPMLMSISAIEDGRYLEVNDRFCEISGFSRQELFGRTSVEIGWFPAAQRQTVIEIFNRGGRIRDTELILTAKDGTLVYCLYSAVLICVEGENQLLSIALDITERKRSEEKIRQQAQFLDLAHDNIMVRGEDDRIIYWNRGAEECYGWSREEAAGQVIHGLLQTAFPIPQAEIQRLLLQNGTWQGELLQTKRDGSQITVSSRWSRIQNDLDHTSAVLEISSDIGDRLRLQQEQEKNQRIESLGILAGGIAHDFNNILTAILGNVSMSRMFIGEEHKAAQRLADCEKAVKRASELTQQLLTFARGGEPVKRLVHTVKLVGEAVGFALQGANVKGVIEAEDDLYPVSADEGQLSQVFNNLLINAQQAMPGGGTVTVSARNLRVHGGDSLPLASGSYVQIDIADQGGGIAPEHLGRIFDPYFTTKASGNGLGLATVYSIIKRHGGHISVRSETGRGTVFSLFLPAVEGTVAPRERNRTSKGLLSGTGRILLMDDEEAIRDLTRVMLEEAGYQVVGCEDGAAAVELYRFAQEQGARFAAVILDLTVPGGMGGREAAALIRRLDPAAVLIVSSGYSNDPVLADYGKYGFNGSAVKPYTFETLLTELSQAAAQAGSGYGSAGAPSS